MTGCQHICHLKPYSKQKKSGCYYYYYSSVPVQVIAWMNVSEMTYNVSIGMLNLTHSLTHSLTHYYYYYCYNKTSSQEFHAN